MTDSSLPVEILEVIFENLISEYTTVAKEGEFLPRWYLLPLLRVCKLWHLVCKRFLYRSISLGSSFPNQWVETIEGPPSPVPTQRPHMIAHALLVKLKGNSRLATLVEELHLHWQLHYIDNVSINMLLIDLCPNLRLVDFRSVPSSDFDMLFEALAERSLVSLRIGILDGSECSSLPIVDIMQRWPKIRSIRIEGWYRTSWQEKLHNSQALHSFNCCPELQEIVLAGNLREKELTSLRLMCNAVTKLDVCVAYSDNAAFEALCGCLHSWAPTLEWCSVRVEPKPSSYFSLSPEALSSLTRLQELRTYNLYVDVNDISSLPQLKRLCHVVPRTYTLMRRYADLLENPEKFTALTDIMIPVRTLGWDRTLQHVCNRRNIVLTV